jgi:hypothetical protein
MMIVSIVFVVAAATAVTTTAAAAITATASAAAITAAAFFVAATAAATTAEAALLVAAATAATFRTGLRLVHDDFATLDFGLVQAADGCIGLIGIGHFYKPKALAAAVHFVFEDFGAANFAEFREHSVQVFIGHGPAKVSNVNVHCNNF